MVRRVNENALKEKEMMECPFCGGQVRIAASHGITYFLCEDCGALVSFRGKEEPDAAKAAWNQRHA